jgi:hypothetical protein
MCRPPDSLRIGLENVPAQQGELNWRLMQEQLDRLLGKLGIIHGRVAQTIPIDRRHGAVTGTSGRE